MATNREHRNVEPLRHGELVPEVEKIAVVRCNGLGDLIFALPALEALQAAYPGAEIVLLAADWHRDFLAGGPSPVDRVIPVPLATGLRETSGHSSDDTTVKRFFELMRAEGFDLALQMHGGGRLSNPFVRRLGARVTAGSRSPDAAPLDRSVRYVFHQHEVLRYLEIVGLVGAPPVSLEPRLAVTEADVAEAQELAGGPRKVVLHPGATDPRRLWSSSRFSAAGDAFAAGDAAVVVSGSAAERDRVEAVASSMKFPALPLAGRLSLRGLAGLLSSSDLVVANDSGPLHLAAAVGTPTVGIFWASSALNAPPLSRARHRPLLSFRVHCPRCHTDQTRVLCGHAVSYVDDISVSEVVAAGEDLLGHPPSDAAALARALDWRPGPGLRTVEWER